MSGELGGEEPNGVHTGNGAAYILNLTFPEFLNHDKSKTTIVAQLELGSKLNNIGPFKFSVMNKLYYDIMYLVQCKHSLVSVLTFPYFLFKVHLLSEKCDCITLIVVPLIVLCNIAL